jgi:hypothetical protein
MVRMAETYKTKPDMRSNNVPVKVDMHTVSTVSIDKDVFRMTISKANHVSYCRPCGRAQSESISSLIPCMRVVKLLYKPPVKERRIWLQAELLEEHCSP